MWGQSVTRRPGILDQVDLVGAQAENSKVLPDYNALSPTGISDLRPPPAPPTLPPQ